MRKYDIDKLISEFNLVHNGYYDYSEMEYVNSRTKIKIICPKHGEFYQRSDAHKKGQGCRKCSLNNRTTPKGDLITKMNKIHNNTYEYDLTNYNNTKSLISIFCKEHGEFKLTPNYHLSGYGCPDCSYINYKTKTESELRKILNTIHKNKYEYLSLKIDNLNSMIKISCPKHGKFEQIFKSHLNGHGCRKCYYERGECININDIKEEGFTIISTNKKSTIYNCEVHGILTSNTSNLIKNGCRKCNRENKSKSVFRSKMIESYGDRYEFDDNLFTNYRNPLEFYDSLKGYSFKQSPSHRLSGRIPNMNTEIFTYESNKKHNNSYDYSKVNYTNSKVNVTITCKDHGDFDQIPNNHLMGSKCPKCVKINPINEEEVYEFIKERYSGEIIRNDRSILNNKEIDIYLPDLKIGIEYNGLYWHSELYKEDKYHLSKTELCEEKDIQLIHIFEDEWLYKRDIVKSRLLNLLGESERVYARKCEVKEVKDNKTIREFLIENHLQGFVGSIVKLGLYHNNELISLMTFGNLRKILGQNSKEGSYELLRFCNKLNTTVIGGASKLFKHFIRNYNPEYILSYADRRWSNGNLYEKLDFKFTHNTIPNFFIVDKLNRMNRFNFRKDRLISEGFDPNKTARQIMLDRGYYRIYDSGSKKYEYLT